MTQRKFEQEIRDPVWGTINEIAKRRGITVQELLRAVAIPDWLEKNSQ